MLVAPLVAILCMGTAAVDLPFVPFDVFLLITRPPFMGPIITVGIDTMAATLHALGLSVADTAKTAEQAMAVGIALIVGALAGAIFFAVMNRRERRSNLNAGWALGALFGAVAVALALTVSAGQWRAGPFLQVIWLMVMFVLWGGALAWIYNRLRGQPVRPAAVALDPEALTVQQLSRRRFLIRAGAATAAITVIGVGLGSALASAQRRREEARAAEEYETHPAESIDPTLGPPNLDAEVEPVLGTRPELTPVSAHYRIFIGLRPSAPDLETWRLKIDGLVDNPLELSVADLKTNYEPIHRYVTLSCISNRVGGDLIGTTLWSGASFKQVLADAGVQPEAEFVVIESADGFYETVSLREIEADERIMLTYDWDGQPLPADHGAPLRVYLPDRFGMEAAKWIDSMRVVADYEEGYWVRRGWSETARMVATSVIDVVGVEQAFELDGQRVIPIGGIAHAGDRGISRVEVRVDGSDWQAAHLREPLSDTTWVLWRYEWPFEAGEHTFEVRCIDGSGVPQEESVSPPHPDGATGIHQVEAEV
jgi:sulfite oxidase